MAGRFEQLHFERADLHPRAISRRDMLIMDWREMRDIHFRAGPLRQLAKAGREVGVRMTVEDGDNLESLSLRFLKVILDVALRVDHGGFTVRAKEIGGVRKSFDKESL